MKTFIKSYLSYVLIAAILVAWAVHFYLQRQLANTNVTNTNFSQLAQDIDHSHDATKEPTEQWLTQHYGKAITILNSFNAGPNLRGYVVSLKANPQAHSIIYSVNQGQYFLVGTLIDRHGKNISLLNAHHYIASPKAKAIYTAAQQLSGVKQGLSTAPQVTVIIDPNSNVFPEQWHEFGYDAAQGEFSVKWVLVNYLKPMGPNTAASILQAKDPLAALGQNAKYYNQQTQTGGFSHAAAPSKQTIATLRKNWSFVQKFNLYQLPITVVKHHDKYYVIHGVAIDETLENIFSSN